MAQTVDQVFDGMIAAENAGYRGVDDYVLKTNTMGVSTLEYYEKTSSLTLDNGQTVYVMRKVPTREIGQRQSSNPLADASPEDLEDAATKTEDAGKMMEQGMRSEMQSAGLPGGLGSMLMNPPPGKPWLSANPRDTTYMYATMLRGAAEGKRQQGAENPEADARERLDTFAQIRAQTRIIGNMVIDGRPSVCVGSNDLNHKQVADGGEFTAHKMSLCVDAESYVPRRLKIEGELRDGKETRAMAIERDDKEYTTVPGCGDMYRPMVSVMRISSVMSPKQQAEMQKAQAQLADFEKQMAQMPESQKAMIMRQMGPQMEMMKKMSASGGAMEFESRVVELRCNTGLPDPSEISQTVFGGTSAGAGMTRGGAVPAAKTRP